MRAAGPNKRELELGQHREIGARKKRSFCDEIEHEAVNSGGVRGYAWHKAIDFNVP
jgi:hypothetical protein